MLEKIAGSSSACCCGGQSVEGVMSRYLQDRDLVMDIVESFKKTLIIIH